MSSCTCCTDGLTIELSDAEIAAVLGADMPLGEQAQRLVVQANLMGGSDNISFVLISAMETDSPQV